ncbi:hypothetical protein [Ekhidna sp.]|uniref:hypothetical protein n=1 Tax=Ekhidna sp. TaxID=2608089 RepID=UPI003B5AF7F3
MLKPTLKEYRFSFLTSPPTPSGVALIRAEDLDFKNPEGFENLSGLVFITEVGLATNRMKG